MQEHREEILELYKSVLIDLLIAPVPDLCILFTLNIINIFNSIAYLIAGKNNRTQNLQTKHDPCSKLQDERFLGALIPKDDNVVI